MTKRSDQKAATRAKLLSTAKTLFEREGYEATTIRDIAHIAGLSTGAFFVQWPTKADAYREIYGHDPVSPEQGRDLIEALRWARTCVPYPSDAHSRIVAVLDAVAPAPAQSEAA